MKWHFMQTKFFVMLDHDVTKFLRSSLKATWWKASIIFCLIKILKNIWCYIFTFELNIFLKPDWESFSVEAERKKRNATYRRKQQITICVERRLRKSLYDTCKSNTRHVIFSGWWIYLKIVKKVVNAI